MEKSLMMVNHQTLISSVPRIRFLIIINQFINAAKAGEVITRSGNRYSNNTIYSFKSLSNTIHSYEEKFGKVYISDINLTFIHFYIIHLISLNMSKSSIGNMLGRFKSIIRRAAMAGLTQFTGLGIPVFKEHSEQVFLQVSELRIIRHYKYHNAGEKLIADIFILHCMLGMRVSDYFNFLRNPKDALKNIDGIDIVVYNSVKTKTKSAIPLSASAKEILEQYNYVSPPLFPTTL